MHSRSYEAVLIFPTQFNADRVEQARAHFQQRLEKLQGKLSQHVVLGKRFFGYSIKKQREGIYLHAEFQMPTSKLDELKHALNLSEELLRYSVFVKTEPTAKAQALKAASQARAAQMSSAGKV